ncbi:MAG TPA: hypothetical protein VGQ00_02380 [Candidatus Norongarragalinales archaeon]|jgi:hypothetical protein|nr:hypothetical protein [Candidatus Norongarragalinales archaeon]
MDFTFLFLAVLVLLALQTKIYAVAAGLIILLLFISKNKILTGATLLGIAIASLVFFGGEVPTWFVLVGLFIILAVATKMDSGDGGMTPQGYMPGQY